MGTVLAAAAVGGVSVATVAAVETGGIDTVSPFLQLGAIGALALLLLVFARGAYQREVRRSDALETELQRINSELRDRIVPVMTDAVRVLGDANAVLRDRR